MRRGEEEDQQQEDQQQEQGRRTGVCIGNAREKRKMRSSGAAEQTRQSTGTSIITIC
jgi:hypothetical protein